MVIKLPFTATLKGHVEILNPLLVAGFREIRAEYLTDKIFRSNDAPRFGEVWCFLTMC